MGGFTYAGKGKYRNSKVKGKRGRDLKRKDVSYQIRVRWNSSKKQHRKGEIGADKNEEIKTRGELYTTCLKSC